MKGREKFKSGELIESIADFIKKSHAELIAGTMSTNAKVSKTETNPQTWN